MSGARDEDVPDGMEVDSASGFMSRTLMVLKGKTSPETRLSTEDLQVVLSDHSILSQHSLDEKRTFIQKLYVNANGSSL